jgi:flagellar FliL protein
MAISKPSSLPLRGTLPPGNSGSRLLRPIIGLVLLLVVAGGASAITWMLTSRHEQAAEPVQPGNQPNTSHQVTPTTFTAPPTKPIPVPAPIFITIDPFTVTLQSDDDERVMHVSLTLRVSDEQSRLRIEKYMPEVRSRILMLLSSQSPTTVQSAQGKVDLAAAIAQAVNRPFAPLPDGQHVTDVLFTAFLVQ